MEELRQEPSVPNMLKEKHVLFHAPHVNAPAKITVLDTIVDASQVGAIHPTVCVFNNG